MSLTGRYKFECGLLGRIVLHVEHYDQGSYRWKPATKSDLPLLEPEVADGWRFRGERNGMLCGDGKRIWA